MASNQNAYDSFWRGVAGRGNAANSTGDKLWSYATVILQRTPNMTIGNTTRYSNTTSKHQSQGRVRDADVLVDRVPRGTSDLLPHLEDSYRRWLEENPP